MEEEETEEQQETDEKNDRVSSKEEEEDDEEEEEGEEDVEGFFDPGAEFMADVRNALGDLAAVDSDQVHVQIY